FAIKPLDLHAIVPSLTVSGIAYVLGSLLTKPPSDEVRALFGKERKNSVKRPAR
ncbi:MAG: hypothetical protein GX324_09595, partial [Aeromonadales bacterium]|nr:hypothetical protein [Aeromonadales bacterium]